MNVYIMLCLETKELAIFSSTLVYLAVSKLCKNECKEHK